MTEIFIPTLSDGDSNSQGVQMPTGKETDLTIGSGKIVALVGKGGMAAVYKIWNQGLDQFHAIKLAYPGQQQNYARFTTEAKIASKLKHTNIVEIKNVGQWKGLPYIEMEFIDGKTLREVVADASRLPPSVACAIAIFIVRALNHAHSAIITIDGKDLDGIIHRDLKPENTMISKNGQITIMDFGLARPINTSLNLTQLQSFLGTPQYAAPEQFGFEKIDQRIDIYAVGAILYEMLTGYQAFPCSLFYSVTSDMDAMLSRIIASKRKKKYKPLKDFNAGLPPKLVKLIGCCLEPDKQNRYQTSRDLLDDLEYIYKSMTRESAEACTQKYFACNCPTSNLPAEKKSKANFLPVFGVVGSLAIIVGLAVFFLKIGLSPNHAALIQDVNDIPATKLTPLTNPESENQLISKKSHENVPSQTDRTEFVAKSTSAPKIQSSKKTDEYMAVSVSQSLPPQRRFPQLNVKTEKKSAKGTAIRVSTSASSSLNAVQTQAVNDTFDQSAKLQEGVDPIAAAELAILKQDYNNALRLLSGIPANHPKADIKTVLSVDIYRLTGKFTEAKELIDQSQVNAAEFDLAAGKIFLDMGNYQKAVRYFNQAKGNKCIAMSKRPFILDDAAYLRAKSFLKLFKEDNNKQTLVSSREAWNDVKRIYSNRTDNPRYKEAVEVLSRL